MKNEIKKPTKEQIKAQAKFNEIQRKEILSEENMKFAFEALGRKPSKLEAALHFALNGGAKKFRKKYGHLVRLYDKDDKP